MTVSQPAQPVSSGGFLKHNLDYVTPAPSPAPSVNLYNLPPTFPFLGYWTEPFHILMPWLKLFLCRLQPLPLVCQMTCCDPPAPCPRVFPLPRSSLNTTPPTVNTFLLSIPFPCVFLLLRIWDAGLTNFR